MPDERGNCAKCAKEDSLSHLSQCSRCKSTTYCSKECQVAHWPSHKSQCRSGATGASGSSSSNTTMKVPTKKMDLKFMIHAGVNDGLDYNFKEDIPASYCTRTADRNLTSKFVDKLIDARELDIMRANRGKWKCLYCRTRTAVRLLNTPMVTLHAEPPTVLNVAQPLCEQGQCAREANARIESAMAKEDSPMKEAEIYKM
ncbi:hypothetical protein PLICRDRAFT_57962 [Plicaturopsis crispa FD-325 SS-3]|uniref:MYND-type domain-containing protein n=1 Tax=Plicaturopsis crispa FD-325 SS-3 TaxID=944288 RepID=A0A0C9SX59_PLICR|nr:hypothetical protein PLICRDRAFT_57962 [Plicaturopsis crispa FD-325 SS-3]